MTADLLAGVLPASLDEALDILQRFHATRTRRHIRLTLPKPRRWQHVASRLEEQQAALPQRRGVYWRTWDEYERDIRAVARACEMRGKTCRIWAQFPIGAA